MAPPAALLAAHRRGACALLAGALGCLRPAAPDDYATAFLSTSPGGMTEMGVTASLIGADVTLVVAFQMFRILFILFAVPYLLRWGFRRAAARSPEAEGSPERAAERPRS
ncbi:AbrB family transcriptional regulator [Paenibacillus mucilaginosus]|nr:AbrB family transcriptional regulator [Paenibacillus caseinilyticus]MCZ8520734.1 AbrB family transcriptional regulator [Paenibacillus caseinilyticus]